MHEASLMKNLMRRIDEAARGENACRVTGLSVWLGALCHMSESHFTEHFEEAASGSIAEGARLDITVSDDIDHPEAQDVVIESVEVET